MYNSNIKINETLLSMIFYESLENIKKYYDINKKQIDVKYQDYKIITDSISYERKDVIMWLSTFIELHKLLNYETYIKQCIFTDNIVLLHWFYDYDKSFLTKLINESDDLFLSVCENNAIKCWDLIKTIKTDYRIEIKENKIVDKWKTNDVLFYIFHETAQEKSSYSNITFVSSEDWNFRQILRIHDEENLTKKLNTITDDQFMPSTCGVFDKTTINSAKRSSKHCKYQICAKIDNFDELIKKLSILDTFPLKKSTCILDEHFDYIKYDLGDKFDMHFDSKKNINHNHTLLLFPPQKIEGGELIVKYGFNDDWGNKQVEKIIKPHEHLWTLVLFPIGVFHASNSVLCGQKTTLKGTAFINNIQRIKIINERFNYSAIHSYGLADGSFHRNYSSTFYDDMPCWKDKIDNYDVINSVFDDYEDEEW